MQFDWLTNVSYTAYTLSKKDRASIEVFLYVFIHTCEATYK